MVRAPSKDANIKKDINKNIDLEKLENQQVFSSWTAKISSQKI